MIEARWSNVIFGQITFQDIHARKLATVIDYLFNVIHYVLELWTATVFYASKNCFAFNASAHYKLVFVCLSNDVTFDTD